MSYVPPPPPTKFQSTLPIRGETPDVMRCELAELFQSTLPIRGETRVWACPPKCGGHFNPLFPYGERPPSRAGESLAEAFQSTLPIRGETGLYPHQGKHLLFQSTLPIRGETPIIGLFVFDLNISIHSSHTGRDRSNHFRTLSPPNFNPLFPYGERRQIRDSRLAGFNFNPLFPYGERPFWLVAM